MTDPALLTEPCEAFSGASWSCCAVPPGMVSTPAGLEGLQTDWMPAAVPGTVASALRAAGKWDYQHPVDLDAYDWWFRADFKSPLRSEASSCELCFDGLAGISEVWLNGEGLLNADNMFRTYRVDVASALLAENELVLVFRSMTADLKKRRPRPRWKTNLISNQQLRWQRTSLLGRIPGWTPPLPAIGPWREIRLECQSVVIRDLQRTTSLDGEDGVVNFSAEIQTSSAIESASLWAGDCESDLAIVREAKGVRVSGSVRVRNAPLWWPHTHGQPQLLECGIKIRTASGLCEHALERVGFRRLEVESVPGFALRVNGEAIYCRGACWTIGDIFTHSSAPESLRHELTLARDAGVNMVRIGGTMTYEGDAFYRLCDELGILVWQDFMFANMDYPVDDAGFSENITIEARQQLDRLAQHPCVAVYCGSSEIEQQAAMLGMPRELWRNDWFGERLPAICAEHHPGTAYVPSSPSGGVLPFHAASGITHYYGIGAYLRPMRELRQADVKFTTECLGFANIPEPEVIDEIMGGSLPVTHHPRWKQRVPRDTGAGWDFEDVRDHYLEEVFGADPVTLRCFDMPRYLELSRVVSGEMMARAFAEWRSGHSRNAGGLVWFFKDLWAASGWGIVDHHGMPKAAYYQLKRVWQSRQLTITDEGLDGLHLHLINETTAPITGFLEVQLLREPNVVTAHHEVEVVVEPRATKMISADEVIGAFHDVNYAYRFGPQTHHAVVATWMDEKRKVISESVHLTRCKDPEPQPLTAEALQTEGEAMGNGTFRVTLTSDRLLHAVRFSAKGFLPDDNYFHLPPGRSKTVTFSPLGGPSDKFRTYVEALNLLGEVSVEVKQPSE
ncbi:MAG: glycoside hydrolase family 2 protein [Verrucomicrobiales bacterium]|nr:glycoside hydrolase family 2 protein [Verrucomicrobiales bacterium]MCP5559597.1 glycoside hydrolase family 2 protein [Verrucomicrobiaceae bacterium]